MGISQKGYENRDEFARELGYSDIKHIYIRNLIKSCITHHKYQEHFCNGCIREKLNGESWEDYDKLRNHQMDWLEEANNKLESRIKAQAERMGIEEVKFQGDPRGPTVILTKNGKEIPACVWNWR